MKRETWKLGGRELIILHILHIRSRILEKSSMEEEFTEGEKGKKYPRRNGQRYRRSAGV